MFHIGKTLKSHPLYAPVNILPVRGGGAGHTRGFRQKTIPDRREFDKLMESGSRVIEFGRFLHPGTREYRRHKIKKGSNRERSRDDSDIFIRVFDLFLKL